MRDSAIWIAKIVGILDFVIIVAEHVRLDFPNKPFEKLLVRLRPVRRSVADLKGRRRRIRKQIDVNELAGRVFPNRGARRGHTEIVLRPRLVGQAVSPNARIVFRLLDGLFERGVHFGAFRGKLFVRQSARIEHVDLRIDDALQAVFARRLDSFRAAHESGEIVPALGYAGESGVKRLVCARAAFEIVVDIAVRRGLQYGRVLGAEPVVKIPRENRKGFQRLRRAVLGTVLARARSSASSADYPKARRPDQQ